MGPRDRRVLGSGDRAAGRWRALRPGKRFRRTIGTLVLVSVAFVWWCDHAVRSRAAAHLYGTVEAVPWNAVGLVLGTSERMRGGGPNPWFAHRIAAAAELYHAGKVRHLLVSGDNRAIHYNEPVAMRRALIAAGVDSTRVTMDFAGLRTLDSVVRAKKVFGQHRFTVISQRFHNERAVYIARRVGIEAVGYDARDVEGRQGLRTRLREKGARVKLFIDLLVGTKPRYLGEPVRIGQEVCGMDSSPSPTKRWPPMPMESIPWAMTLSGSGSMRSGGRVV